MPSRIEPPRVTYFSLAPFAARTWAHDLGLANQRYLSRTMNKRLVVKQRSKNSRKFILVVVGVGAIFQGQLQL